MASRLPDTRYSVLRGTWTSNGLEGLTWAGPTNGLRHLKKLWLDGLSASQIAKQLGGVTRNAVIGKVHRLGLSGRATPSQPQRPAFKAPRAPRPAIAAAPRAAPRHRAGHAGPAARRGRDPPKNPAPPRC